MAADDGDGKKPDDAAGTDEDPGPSLEQSGGKDQRPSPRQSRVRDQELCLEISKSNDPRPTFEQPRGKEPRLSVEQCNCIGTHPRAFTSLRNEDMGRRKPDTV